MKQTGILQKHISMFSPEIKHEGLDIMIAHRSRSKKSNVELHDFELLFNGFIMPHAEYDPEKIKHLFDTVIYRYFEQPKIVEGKKEFEQKLTEEVKKEKIIEIKNSKVIKAFRRVPDSEEMEAITYDPNPSEELKSAINNIMKIKATADLQLQEQILYCANKLRVGTLDMPKDSKTLMVHTPDGVQPLEGKVTKKQLVATLWFITRMYMVAPSYRKYLSISISEGKYTCGYDKGEPFFKTENLTQLEKDIIHDLKLIESEG